ncbi:hypothetical protein CLOM_g5951 [Closterium sp. NIES-68]|nr:hypothetical protein CLOM_g5951 [Closterium sp. NIES-68]
MGKRLAVPWWMPALIAWTLCWLALSTFVVWSTHKAALDPLMADLKAWCGARVRYLDQEIASNLNHAEVNMGLIKVFNGFGPKSPDLAYWGYTGCLNNRSWVQYAEATQYAKPWMTNAWLAFVDGNDRPMVERSLGCQFQSLNSLEPKVSSRKDCYVVNLFQYSPFFNWPQCTDYSDRFGEGCGNLNTKWKSRGSPPYRFRNGDIGFSFGIPVLRHPIDDNATSAEVLAALAGFLAPGLDAEALIKHTLFSVLDTGNSTALSFTMYDVTNASNPLMVFGDTQPSTGPNPIYPMVLPAPMPPGDKVVEPFPDDFIGRRYEGHCRYRHPPPVWSTLLAPILLGLLVLLVAALLTFIIGSLARKKARIRQQMEELEEYTLALEQAERSKSEFVANLSHELRTPITGMLGMMDWLLESSMSEWQHRDLLDAKTCAVEAIGLLNSVLDLAKLQANRLVLEALPFSLHQCVDLAVRTLMPDAHKKNLQFICRIHASVPDVLIGDPTRVAQVMRELICHAIRNTVSGRIILHLWCMPAPVPIQAVAEAAEPDLEAWIRGLQAGKEGGEKEWDVYGGKGMASDARGVPSAAIDDAYGGDKGQKEVLLARINGGGSADCCRGSGGAGAADAGGGDGGMDGACGVGCFGLRQGSGREMGGSGREVGGRERRSEDSCEASFRYSLSQDDPRLSDPPVTGFMRSCSQSLGSQPSQPSQSIGNSSHPNQSTHGMEAPPPTAHHDLGHGTEHGALPEPEPWMLHPPIPHLLTAEACREVRRSAARFRQAMVGGRRRRRVERVQLVMACEDTGCGIPWEEMRWVLDPEGHGEFVQEEEMNAYIRATDGTATTSTTTSTTPSAGRARSSALSRLRSLAQRVVKGLAGGGGGSSEDGLYARVGKGFQDAWTPYPVRFLLSASLVSLMRGCMGVATQEQLGSTIMVSLPMKMRHVAHPTSAGEEQEEEEEGEEDGAGEDEQGEEGEESEGSEGGEGMEEALAWVEMRWSTSEAVEGRRALVVDGDDARAEATSIALRYFGMHVTIVGTQKEAARKILGRQSESAWRFAEKRMSEARRRARRAKGKEGGVKLGEGEHSGEGDKPEERPKEGRNAADEEGEGKREEEGGESCEMGEEGAWEEEQEGPWGVVLVEADAFGKSGSVGANSKSEISGGEEGAQGAQASQGGQIKPGPVNGSDAPQSKSGIGFGRRIKFDHRSLVLFHSSAVRAPNSPPRTPFPSYGASTHAAPNSPPPTPSHAHEAPPAPAATPAAATPAPAAPPPVPCSLPPLVLTGQGSMSVNHARVLAAGFADTLPQPWLVADLAPCLHAIFAPLDQYDDLSDSSTNHIAPAVPSSSSSLAPSTPPRPKSPQYRSKAALALSKPEDAAALLKEMLSGKEVLVVDDNAVNRMVARKTLQGLGAKVELVESGEKALERLNSANTFFMLLIDLHMPPGIDGYETARRIRAKFPAATAAPTTSTATSSSSSASIPKLESQPSFSVAAAAAATAPATASTASTASTATIGCTASSSFSSSSIPMLESQPSFAAAAAATATATAPATGTATTTITSIPKLESQPSFAFHPGCLTPLDLDAPGEIEPTLATAATAAAAASAGPFHRQVIFALTADVDASVRHSAKEAGMDGTLSKPIVHPELLSALKAAGVTLH